MGIRTYKATGAMITTIRRLVGLQLRLTGGEDLPDRPTLFVVNHFTRLETPLIPYAIFHQIGRQVQCLATDAVFRKPFDRYLHAVGVMSVRDPRRNRSIISDLMTGRMGWVIYPEGGLVKNKRTVRGDKLELRRPGRCGPPHTGAAMLALKAEIGRRRFLDACERGDLDRVAFYREQYDVENPGDVSEVGPQVVPVTITYHTIRSRHRTLNRLAALFCREIDPRLEEELQVEGSILFGNTEINVHLGTPLDVSEYLETNRPWHRLMRRNGADTDGDTSLRRPARRLTADAMRTVYGQLEINLEHLFCYGLRTLQSDEVSRKHFHRALYLAATELRKDDRVRLHPSLRNGITSLATNSGPGLWQPIAQLASDEGVIAIDNGSYRIRRDQLEAPVDFHDIRLTRLVRVMANELEPIRPATEAVRRAVNLSPADMDVRLPEAARELDRRVFERDHERWGREDERRPLSYREPFLLTAPDARRAAVLVHGYCACPQQVRPLAEHLHTRGTTTYGVRLDGHGTAPEHLMTVRWRAWIESIHQGLAAVHEQYDDVTLIGFSLGGILALMAAAEHTELVDRVVTINAPFRVRDPRTVLVPAVDSWHQLLEKLGFSDGAFTRPRRTGFPDTNYDVDSIRSLRELRRAIIAGRRSLGRVQAPALVIQASADPVVHPASGRRIVRRLSGAAQLETIDLDRHDIIRGHDCRHVYEHVQSFLTSDIAENGRDEGA